MLIFVNGMISVVYMQYVLFCVQADGATQTQNQEKWIEKNCICKHASNTHLSHLSVGHYLLILHRHIEFKLNWWATEQGIGLVNPAG